MPSAHPYDINDRNDKSLPVAAGWRLVREPGDLQAVAAALEDTRLVGLDLETTGLDPRTDRVRLLSLALDTIDGGTLAYLVDSFAVDPAPLWDALAGKELVLHNAAFDLAFLARLGFAPTATVQDTMLLAQLLTAGTRDRCRLEDCCDRHLGRPLDKSLQKADWSGELSDAQLAYAAADAEVLAPLLEVLTARIREAGLVEAAEIERRCLPAVCWLAGQGVAFDRAAWQVLARSAGEEADALRQELDLAAPSRPGTFDGFSPWNWDSPEQVKEALDLAGCPVADTADETLAAVDHPLAQLLRRYRLARKRGSTYGTDWLKHVAADGRVYSDWRQLGTKTGRMASGDPNLQNVPRDPAYRKCFRAPPGRVLVKADYSQIELRVAARIAGEERMIAAYRRGEDLHTLTAQQLTGRQDVTRQERQLAKPVNFGIIYGLGAPSLKRKAATEYGIVMTLEQARRYRDAFLRAWPGITRWHSKLKQSRSTETRTVSGRRVLIPPDTWYGARANYAVQGTAGDGIKLALALLWERRAQALGAFPVLAVHDEIVVEADADRADAVATWLKTAMVDAMAPLVEPVLVAVEVKTAQTWGGA
jgi:DNA polymerase-1